MKTCNISDFMQTIEPWLSENYIRKVRMIKNERVELFFQDGVRQAYRFNDCNLGQIKKMVAVIKQKGIPVIVEELSG